MKKVSGYEIEKIPFLNLRRVANLIEFNGPILSHYIDEYENNYLYYWVDNDDKFNRWLIWKVDEILLYKYLCKEISLDFLFAQPGENVYIADINENLEYSQILITYSNLIEQSYRPEIDAYFQFDLPEVYSEKIKSLTLLQEWKARALYFNVEPASQRYGVTVGLADIWDVFENIGKSFNEYVEYSAKNILSKRMTDFGRIKAASKALSSMNRLRVVYLNLNSFHFGIAADILNIDSIAIDPSIEDLHSKVLTQYQNDVLDNDFSSNIDVDILVQKFPDEEARKKIFEPVIKIINNENIKININDYSNKFEKTYNRISKIEKNKLAPPKPSLPTELTENSQTLMVAYVVADKNSQQTLFPKDLTNRLIYAKEIEKFFIEIEEIILPNGDKVSFKRSIDAEVTFESNQFTLVYEPLNILLSVSDRKELDKKFTKEIVDAYIRYKDNDNTYSIFFKELID